MEKPTANKTRKRAPKRVKNGTYTHRLSGLLFCADCGGRLSYARPSEKLIKEGRDGASRYNFQCSNYRNRYDACSNHYIKTCDIEAIILKAVQAVSEHVLENENDFIDQLMEQWNIKQMQSSAEEKQELETAKKRMKELDDLIKGLYESQIKGTLPERQAQRLISQYDEEQLQLESRIAELDKSDEVSAPKKADINKFIALVRKYQHITELTDRMLYEFIDKVVVHAPNGGMGRYRYQKIDLYFSFIGNYIPPSEVISEEERIASIDAYYKKKDEMKKKKSAKKKKEKESELKERAKTDPEAAAEYEALLQKHREDAKRYRAAAEARKKQDTKYQAELAEKAAKKTARDKLAYFRKLKIGELEEMAKTDPEAAAELVRRREKAAAKNRRAKANRIARIASDPEYAAQRAEIVKQRNERARKKRAELKKAATSDPEAAARYEALKAKERKFNNKYHAEERERAKGDPEYAAKRKERKHEQSKKQYANYKAKMDELKACADIDPKAAAAIEAEKAAVSAKNRRYRVNLKEQAKTDPIAAQKIVDRRIRKRELARQAKAKDKSKTAEVG